MCKQAAQTAGAVLGAVEPELTALLTAEGIATTPAGEAALAAYKSAVTSLDDWQSGTPAQEAIQALDDFQAAFNVLPFPPTVTVFENIIEAAIVTVIGILTANSPAPANDTTAEPTASAEETVAAHQAFVAADTTAKVQALVPTFKRSIFHSPAWQVKNEWNKAVESHPELGISAV
jgi:hypothetical protein